MNAYGFRAAALHLRYIERDGVEADGSGGRLYGPSDAADVRLSLASRVEPEKRQFRFIVSPEDGAGVDLTAFTRQLMGQVEADLGRQLVWGAVNHWNTDNPHVHVVVRGVDAHGHDVTIDGRYLSEGMRSRAQSILTNELGPRTEVQLQDQLAREVHQERYTSLDRALQACQETGGTLFGARLPRYGHVSGARLMARLARLEQLGLVSRVSAIQWRFQAGWDDTLRGLGQANDIIKRMHAATPTSDPSRFIILDESTPLPAVDGVIRSKGLHDELAAQPFAVIEAVDGRVFYTRIELTTAERIRQGDVVRIAVEPRTPRSDSGPDTVGPPMRAARAPIRVQRLGPPIPLQQRYRGPTWLDTVDARNLPKPAPALAAELADAVPRRSANVRAMGIDMTEPARRLAELAALEERTFAADVAGKRGFTLVDPRASLAGTLTLSAKLPSGRQYAIVSDAATEQLCVVPADKRLRLLEGQRVRIWRDSDGRIAVAALSLGRGPTR